MKKFVLWLSFIILVSMLFGCASLQGTVTDQSQEMIQNHKELMAEIPDNVFEKFEYHRNGPYSSMNIIALGASKVGGALIIDSVTINASYKFNSFSSTLEGYERQLATEEK